MLHGVLHAPPSDVRCKILFTLLSAPPTPNGGHPQPFRISSVRMMSSSSSSLAGHSSSSRRRASSTYNGDTSGINALYEFLEEAELQHHYLGLRNVLRVQSVHQLRSVLEDDLVGIGMSEREALRLRVRAHSSAGAPSAKVNSDSVSCRS